MTQFRSLASGGCRVLVVALAAGLIGAACASDSSDREAPSRVTAAAPTSVAPADTPTPEPSPSQTPDPAPTAARRGPTPVNFDIPPTPSVVSEDHPCLSLVDHQVAPSIPSAPFDQADLCDLMNRLVLSDTFEPRTQLFGVIEQANDERLVPVLIELLWAMEVGPLPPSDYRLAILTLNALTGQELRSWPEWVGWYAGTSIQPPPGFVDWKGYLFEPLDRRFRQFFSETHPRRIRVEEVVWGGVRLDGIPPLDDPTTIAAVDADYLEPEDLVFGVSLGGEQRAYPLRIMDWHEMVNDVVGGIPVSLAYCTLCGAGVLYDGRVGDEVFTFASSGFLMRSNKLMYDRKTLTLWNQLTGEPVLGALADSSIRLSILPVVVTTWAAWTEQHPDTRVLSIDTGFPRNYRRGTGYGAYYTSPETMFAVPLRRDPLAQKDRVFAITLDGLPRAYPTKDVTREGVVNDRLGDTNLAVIGLRGDLTGTGFDQSNNPVSWDAGAEVRAYERRDHTFSPGPDADTVQDETGALWRVGEEALEGPAGQSLARLPGHLAYWFGWLNYYPQTTVYGIDE